MRLLAIECSAGWLSVCAFDGGARAVRREHAGAGASALILGFVRAVLLDAGWALRDLDGIAYGSGPGAFTGLRLACGTVQGLARGAALPVAGVPSLEAIAQAAWHRHGVDQVLACVDARMREVYYGAYRRAGAGWRCVAEPAVGSSSGVMLPASNRHGWFGAGDGFAIDAGLAARLAFASVDASIVPDAVHVAELAAPVFASGGGASADKAQPLYVRHRIALTAAERAMGAVL